MVWKEGDQSLALFPLLQTSLQEGIQWWMISLQKQIQKPSLSCKLNCRAIHSRIEDALSNGFCQISA